MSSVPNRRLASWFPYPSTRSILPLWLCSTPAACHTTWKRARPGGQISKRSKSPTRKPNRKGQMYEPSWSSTPATQQGRSYLPKTFVQSWSSQQKKNSSFSPMKSTKPTSSWANSHPSKRDFGTCRKRSLVSTIT